MKGVKDFLTVAGYVLLIVGVIAFGLWIAVLNWTECRDVGHSWFYCFRHMGR